MLATSCFASSIKMLGLLVLAILGLAAAHTRDRLALINYGVVLEERGDVDLNRENWIHTFKVDFPTEVVFPQDPTDVCLFDKKELCTRFPDVSGHFISVKEDLMREWESLMGLYRSLPLTNFTRANPNTPEGQVTNSIYNNIQDQKTGSQNFLHNPAKSSSMLLMSVQVVALVKDLQVALSDFKTLVSQAEKKLDGSSTDDIVSSVAAASDRAWKVHVSAQRIRDALTAAKRNVLTKDLMRAEQLTTAIVNVEYLMQSEYHPFMVAKFAHNAQYYYNNDVPVYLHRDGNLLYISLTIPLTYGPHFKAYRVMPFPLVYGNSPYGTLLTELPDYFLMTPNATLYTTMSSEQFDQCQQSEMGVTTCPESHTSLSGSLLPHCVLGLVRENKTMVQQECQYGLLAAPLQPSLWEYAPGSVLLTQTEEALVKCNDITHRVKSAPVQVVSLPCSCSLSANNMEVQDRLLGCAKDSVPSSLFPVNLGALLQVHSATSLAEYNGTGLLPQPSTLDLPNLVLTPPARQDLHDLHPGMALNLTTVMLKWRAGEKVYTSPVDALLEAEKGRLEAGPHTTVTVLAVLASILFALSAFSLYVLTRNHRHLHHRLHLLEHHACFDSNEDTVPMQIVTQGGQVRAVSVPRLENGDAAERANLTNVQ